jgi:hypothetical protein
MHRLHGCHGRGTAGAQRVPHEAAGGRSRPRHVGSRHAQGRDERRAARLGHQRARHVLLHRHGGGPAPVPRHGPRFPGHHRQGNQEPDHGGRGPSARHDHRGHRRRVERDGPVLSVPRRHRCRHHRRRGRRQGRERQDGTLRLADRRAARGSAWQPHVSVAGRGWPDPRRSLDLCRARLSGHRAGACVAPRYRARPICLDHRHRGAGGVPAVLRDRGHHPRARAVPCAGPCHQDRGRPAVRPPDRDEHVRPRRQGHLRNDPTNPGRPPCPISLFSASMARPPPTKF